MISRWKSISTYPRSWITIFCDPTLLASRFHLISRWKSFSTYLRPPWIKVLDSSLDLGISPKISTLASHQRSLALGISPRASWHLTTQPWHLTKGPLLLASHQEPLGIPPKISTLASHQRSLALGISPKIWPWHLTKGPFSWHLTKSLLILASHQRSSPWSLTQSLSILPFHQRSSSWFLTKWLPLEVFSFFTPNWADDSEFNYGLWIGGTKGFQNNTNQGTFVNKGRFQTAGALAGWFLLWSILWTTILLLLSLLKMMEVRIVPPVEAAACQIILDRTKSALFCAIWVLLGLILTLILWGSVANNVPGTYGYSFFYNVGVVGVWLVFVMPTIIIIYSKESKMST